MTCSYLIAPKKLLNKGGHAGPALVTSIVLSSTSILNKGPQSIFKAELERPSINDKIFSEQVAPHSFCLGTMSTVIGLEIIKNWRTDVKKGFSP